MKRKAIRRHYDLEDRTLKFAQDVRSFIKRIPRDMKHAEDTSQLLRSSGSIGANYIEANEALSKKDFVYRLKIAKKEAKESRYWLNLLESPKEPDIIQEHKGLCQESTEIMNIFGAIIHKIENRF